ncbi:hypothetical protein CONPUDRAFT_54049, partial [Coniophora puteana RWD-64-598 SS2]
RRRGGEEVTLSEQQLRYVHPRHPAEPQDARGNDGCSFLDAAAGGTKPNMWAPFLSQMDWEIARWAKMRGPSSTAFSELLAIPGVSDALDISYKNAPELNAIIDNSIPAPRPAFTHSNIVAGDESFDMFSRDILECIRALYGDPEHAQYLSFQPEQHYATADKAESERLYHDMQTGKWWWSTQEVLEQQKPGATIIPVILSSDKTQITLFRNKTAYPVYLTIGNLPKSIRRKPSRQGQILLAYLPTSRLEHITNKSAKRRVLANMFHACMSHITEPLRDAGINGIAVTSGDGVTRRGHPILAAYVGDYPEQCLVTAAYSGTCPICDCNHNSLGDYPTPSPPRDPARVISAFDLCGSDAFSAACRDANVKAIQEPFWLRLPFVNIFQSITPDILHQLYQGVFKHLKSWLITACGATEIDARTRRFPPNHNIRVFHKGITSLSRISGAEHKQISRLLLGLIIDAPIPHHHRSSLLRATRSLLDFLYIAQFPLHVLQHYVRAIELFGTTDNFNTESTERLHIDFAKDAYAATNHKDEFFQMTKWLERQEKIVFYSKYLSWRALGEERGSAIAAPGNGLRWHPPDMACVLHQKMTMHPTRPSVTLDDITSASHYDAALFSAALARFIVRFRDSTLTLNQVETLITDVRIPFTSIPVFHRVKFHNDEHYGNETIDSVHVQPPKYSNHGTTISPARFDTVLVRVGDSPDAGIHNLRVAQVKVIFSIPLASIHQLFLPDQPPPKHLAYVEWFTPFASHPEANSGLYRVNRDSRNGEKQVSVVPLDRVERSVHLIPKWGRAVPSEWASHTVLDLCNTFYLNVFKDMHTYFSLHSE